MASSTTHRVIRGALILLSTQPLTWAASLLLVIFVPRLLDSRALGEYQMAVSLEGVLIAVLSLGVPSVLTRRLASHPDTARRDISTALALLVGLGTLGSIVVLLLVPATGLLPISTPLLALVLVGDGADPVPERAARGPDRLPAHGRLRLEQRRHRRLDGPAGDPVHEPGLGQPRLRGRAA